MNYFFVVFAASLSAIEVTVFIHFVQYSLLLHITQYFCNFEAFKQVMRRYIPGSLFIILSGFVLLLISCTPGSCFEETESYLKASFYSGDETKILTAPDSLTIYGLNDTNKVYNKATKVEHALLPLNASTPECTFIIKINGITDTIKFTYTSYPHLDIQRMWIHLLSST